MVWQKVNTIGAGGRHQALTGAFRHDQQTTLFVNNKGSIFDRDRWLSSHAHTNVSLRFFSLIQIQEGSENHIFRSFFAGWDEVIAVDFTVSLVLIIQMQH